MAEQYVYFSKVSLDSTNVYNIQKDPDQYIVVANSIFSALNSDLSYTDSRIYIDSNGESGIEEVNYSIKIINKDEISIEGVIYKTSYLYAKSVNKETNEIVTKPVPNTEDIKFYYDVIHEYIGFHIRNRFGRNQFNKAFTKMLNFAMEKNNFPYSFYVETYSAGITLDNLKNELKKKKDLKKLVLTFQPVNPDDEVRQLLADAGDEYNTLRKMEEANATYKSIVYEAKGLGCLNTESQIIQEDLNSIEQVHSALNTKTMTQRGYVKIDTTDSQGTFDTTSETSPFKRKIFHDYEFIDACKKGIAAILRRVI